MDVTVPSIFGFPQALIGFPIQRRAILIRTSANPGKFLVTSLRSKYAHCYPTGAESNQGRAPLSGGAS